MKPKTKAFADTLLNNPKTSATQAYLDTHITENRKAAAVEASKTLSKPNVQLYMKKHVDKAKGRIVQLVSSDREDVALRASESILNREFGTPRQVTENRSTSLSLTIDLRGLEEE